jgi:prepilin-type processing-associated H-X9-DG protein
MKTKQKTNEGFTRLDVAAVVAITFLIGILGASSAGATASNSQSVTCINNMQQLMRALHLYTGDSNDYLPPMQDNTASTPYSLWLVHLAQSPIDATNTAKLLDPQYSLLAPYLNGNATVFKCPAEPATRAAGGGAQQPWNRSVSMNHAVGSRLDVLGPKAATDGAWLDGNHNHLANSVWRTYARFADIVNPSPANLWIFLDERGESVNDANFASVGPSPSGSHYRWIDYPGKAHNNAGGFGFADGHAEIHAWVGTGTVVTPPTLAGNALLDIGWLANRTSALVTDQP